jgi:hypothetical protein
VAHRLLLWELVTVRSITGECADNTGSPAQGVDDLLSGPGPLEGGSFMVGFNFVGGWFGLLGHSWVLHWVD